MFLMLLRVYFKGNTKQNSVQYFMLSDYDSVDAMVRAGKARYHNVIAADLSDADVTYNAAYLMDQAGNKVEPFFCDDRRPAPEPEPAE